MILYTFEGKEYDLESLVDYSEPSQITKLKRLRIGTRSGTFDPIYGFIQLMNDKNRFLSLYELIKEPQKFTFIRLPDSYKKADIETLICIYLMEMSKQSHKFLKYYFLSVGELSAIHFGSEGVEATLSNLFVSYDCVILDLGETFHKNAYLDTATGCFMDCAEHSSKPALILYRDNKNLGYTIEARLLNEPRWNKLGGKVVLSSEEKPGWVKNEGF
jgi:hypothetical protein